MSGWFGEPWPSETLRAPVCENDEERRPVPLGATCLYCDELIDEGDRGLFTPLLTEGGLEDRAEHIECSIRSVMGPVAYLEGRCTHAGGTEDCHVEGQSLRESALATYEWLQTHERP